MSSYQEVVQSKWWVTAPYCIVAVLLIVAGFFSLHISADHLWITIVAILLSGVLLWLSRQYTALSIDIQQPMIILRFGFFSHQLPRDCVRTAAVSSLRWREIRRLGIFKGRKREMWLTRTGKSVRLELKNGKEIFFTSNNPEAVIEAVQT